MHHIHKTRALVLSSRNLREADKQLNLLTEELGFLKVIAQGIRKMESKLRPSIQDFSVCDVAVVSGRAGWRLTNASSVHSLFYELDNKNLFQSLQRSFDLIEKLVLGESPDDSLFQVVVDFSEFVVENQNKILHQSQVDNLESVLILNILNRLGYLDVKGLDDFIDKKLSLELIESIDTEQRKRINRIINQSIRETGL